MLPLKIQFQIVYDGDSIISFHVHVIQRIHYTISIWFSNFKQSLVCPNYFTGQIYLFYLSKLYFIYRIESRIGKNIF